MTNPFVTLNDNQPPANNYDEWEGQFSCSTYRCNGYAKRAKYFPKLKVLAWECQEGHISKLEDIDE